MEGDYDFVSMGLLLQWSKKRGGLSSRIAINKRIKDGGIPKPLKIKISDRIWELRRDRGEQTQRGKRTEYLYVFKKEDIENVLSSLSFDRRKKQQE